jgi:hypothetical protein
MTSDSWRTMFSGYVVRDDVLDQPVAHTLNDLLQQHGPELLQTCRGILERAEDRFPLIDLQREQANVLGEGAAEPHLEILVVDQAGELKDEPLGDVEACKEHKVDRTRVRVAAEVAGNDMAA